MGRFDGKTEKATPQRKKKARREGQIARSQEIGVAVSFFAIALTIRVFGPTAIDVLRRETTLLLGTLDPRAIPGDVIAGSVGRMVLAMAAPILAVAVLAALVAGFSQTGLVLATKAAQPKLSHLSPKKGMARLKPGIAGWELLRTALKLGLLVAFMWGPMHAAMTHIADDRSISGGVARVLADSWTLIMRAVALTVLIAAADYLWNRRRTTKEQRMSKEEIKQEHKDSEGDPLVRAQRRRRAMDLSRNRMLRDIGLADVVVTNPTHLAVALRYADGEAAPRVIAKGADKLAAKIRGLAHRHGVLVTENKPLARALYRRCKVGQYVPAALYEAVAVVLAVAYRRRGRVAA